MTPIDNYENLLLELEDEEAIVIDLKSKTAHMRNNLIADYIKALTKLNVTQVELEAALVQVRLFAT